MPPPVLWTPPDSLLQRCALGAFRRSRGFDSYDELWRWSVEDLEGFWGSLWEWFEIGDPCEQVLGKREMPGADWFPGAKLNYAEHLLKQSRADEPAIVHASEVRELAEV